jgi:hypothetical protein
MSPDKALTLVLLVLAVASSGISQEEKLKVNKDGQLKVTPEMVEKAKRKSERLRDPSFIKLELVRESNCQDEGDLKLSDCYKAHRTIKMKLLMTNTSSESIFITVNNSYYPYNLQLFRNGKLVPYRKDVAEVADKPPAGIYSNISVKLEPGKTVMAEMLYLDNWYEPLEPGHYRLDLKRRFQSDGGWTAPASTKFKVDSR